MKLFIRFILIISIVVVTRPVIAASASTLFELVSKNDVVKCKKCHDDVAPLWEKASHARPLTNEIFLKSINSSFDEITYAKRRELIRSCFSCHAPYVKDASNELVDHIAELIIISADTEDQANSETAKAELSTLSIDCRVCHMIKGLPEADVQPDVIYGPGWDEHEDSHMKDYGFDTLKSDYLLSSGLCKSCHGGCLSSTSLSNPAKGIECYSNKSNINCYDCHMKDHSFSGTTE
jgi:hypothetical protein